MVKSAVLTRMGNSVGVAIPKEFRTAGFEQGCRVEIEKTADALIIRPVNERPTLQSLMRGYDGPSPEFIDPGASMGGELW